MDALRKKKKSLKKRMKNACEEERRGLQVIWRDLKARHSALSRAESNRKKRSQRKRNQDRFFRGPFQYARQLFEQPKSGSLSVQKEVLETNLKKTYSDPDREKPIEEIEGLVWPSAPGVKFNNKPPSLDEVAAVVRKASSKSAPGPNGVSYLLYKRCPKVLEWLHKIIRGAWKNQKISEQWMVAEGVYIPKEQNSTEIGQFRPISLLNVEGKIFFSVMAARLTKYLTENGYINSSVQKGGIPGISGCLEHSTMIWEAIQRAKSEKLNLDVVWLDLANAYGSVPHQMIQLALRMHHVPDNIREMLNDYFNGFRMRFSTNSCTTEWINLEVGIAMGCTISPILFVLAMEVILKAAEGSASPADLGGGCQMPPLKAFMDDTTILCSKEEETRLMLKRLDDLMAWCRMSFKPKKSRSLSVRKGKVKEAVTFNVAGQNIPTVSQEPVKSLGRWYDSSLKDTKRGAETSELAKAGLQTIDKCGLPGKYKVWCLQFMLIPKLLWPLLVYEISTTTVEAIEAKINRFTRKWLGVPPGLTDVALYCRKAKLRLPLKSVVVEYKCGKARLMSMLEDSEDPVVRAVQPTVKTGRKWKAEEAVNLAKESLKMKEVTGHTQCDRKGLGSSGMKWWSKTEGKERRDMIIEEIRQSEDSERIQKAVQQPQQGQWTSWESALQRSLTWNDLWHMAPLRISFLIRAVYDLLPTNANLVRWGKSEDPTCPLCQGRQTTEHVLSSCRAALTQGRYTWRHNRVLQELATTISTAKGQPGLPDTEALVFTTAGKTKSWLGTPTKVNFQNKYLLDGCDDWVVSADLPGWEDYPRIIKETKLRPDIVIHSASTKQIIMVELTVPYESRMEEANTYKRAKYSDLTRELEKSGYSARVMPVEIGARGFVGASAYDLLSKLSICGNKRRRALKTLAETAENSSRWIWSRRNDPLLHKE